MFLATPFIWPDPAKDAVHVKATMYGMWSVAFATWNGARVVQHERLRVDDASNATKSWTLLDDDGNLVVLIIRKDLSTANVSVTVQVSGLSLTSSYAANSIETSAPSMTSKSGISMAGLTWDGTTDGLPVPIRPLHSSGYRSTRVLPLVRRIVEAGSESDVELGVSQYDVIVRPASVLVLVVPTSHDGKASWQQRVAAVLRVRSVAEPHYTASATEAALQD